VKHFVGIKSSLQYSMNPSSSQTYTIVGTYTSGFILFFICHLSFFFFIFININRTRWIWIIVNSKRYWRLCSFSCTFE
jgi:hypothetical protein